MRQRAAEYLWSVKSNGYVAEVLATTIEKAVEAARALWKRENRYSTFDPCHAERLRRVSHFA